MGDDLLAFWLNKVGIGVNDRGSVRRANAVSVGCGK